jgi:hypothetical protein
MLCSMLFISVQALWLLALPVNLPCVLAILAAPSTSNMAATDALVWVCRSCLQRAKIVFSTLLRPKTLWIPIWAIQIICLERSVLYTVSLTLRLGPALTCTPAIWSCPSNLRLSQSITSWSCSPAFVLFFAVFGAACPMISFHVL